MLKRNWCLYAASTIPVLAKLGEKYRVTGTPTLVFADGQVVPGAVPKAQLEKMLAAQGGKAK